MSIESEPLAGFTHGSGIEDLLSSLASEGSLEAHSGTFKIRWDKASEKLQQFALAQPHQYILLLLSGLFALGARRFDMRVDADDLEIHSDAVLAPEVLESLWSHALGEDRSQALQLVAIAILTSVRFGKARWRIQVGETLWEQGIEGGELREPLLRSAGAAEEGVRVTLKRYRVGDIVARFFLNLSGRSSEERFLRERFHLQLCREFRLNGRSLLEEGTEALAILEIGNPPPVAQPARYRLQDTEGEIPMLAVLTEPGTLSGRVVWSWNGLLMGETPMPEKPGGVSVIVFAHSLPTDLGVTALVDSPLKSRATKDAQEAALSLWRHLLQAYSDGEKPYDMALSDAVASLFADRKKLDLPLEECPIFLCSEKDRSDYTRKSFREIPANLSYCRSHEASLFPDGIPVRKGRPDVYVVNKVAFGLLMDGLRSSLSIDVSERVKNLKRYVLLENGEELPAALKAGPISWMTLEPKAPRELWKDTTEYQGTPLQWSLFWNSTAHGAIQVTRGSETYFGLDLPNIAGPLLFRGELPWKPNFQGNLGRSQKPRALAEVALHALIERLHEVESPRDKACEIACKLVWNILADEEHLWESPAVWERRWALRYLPDLSLERISLKELVEEKEGVPLYYGTAFVPECMQRIPQERRPACLPLPLRDKLLPRLRRPLRKIAALDALFRRPSAHTIPNHHRVLDMPMERAQALDPRLERVRVGLAAGRSEGHSRCEVLCNLWGKALQPRSFKSAIAATVLLDWKDGIPSLTASTFDSEEDNAKVLQIAEAAVLWASSSRGEGPE